MFLEITKTGYTLIAIGIIVVLLIIFFLTYVKNKKTPLPKGCEDMINEERCVGCQNVSCSHFIDPNENKETNTKMEDK